MCTLRQRDSESPDHHICKFSPHTFHLERKIEVFAAEASQIHQNAKSACHVQCTYLPNLHERPFKRSHPVLLSNLCLRLHEMCTLRHRDSERRLLSHSSLQPPSHHLIHHQITRSASSAHIPFILKEKLKFSLQRHRKFTRTPSQLVTFSAPTYQTFMQGLLKGLTKFFSQISVSDCTKCAL